VFFYFLFSVAKTSPPVHKMTVTVMGQACRFSSKQNRENLTRI